MKKENIIRFNRADFMVQMEHLAKAGEDESFSYGLFSKAENAASNIYICKQQVLPDDSELKNQTTVSIEPDRQYQMFAYNLAYDQGLIIMDTHTHPFSSMARFSGIDDHYGIENAKYIAEKFPESVTMGMIVFGKGFDNFEARIWDREKQKFEPVNRIEILGSPTTILTNKKKSKRNNCDSQYVRHQIIPNWNQDLLKDLKVALCGLGGNGALVFDGLLSLGIGSRNGWIKACDPDILEESNLPRIPYTYPEEVGRPKAEIAQVHADYRAPHLNVQCYENGVEDEEMREIIKEANIIIGAIDNDGARQHLNEIASRYMIPFLDLGTEIIPENDTYEAVGQVQAFVPGQTGCLVCSGAIDPCKTALDLMSRESSAAYERAGYVRGTDETPTPSVLHLNGVVSHLAISQLLKLIFDDGFAGREYLHYNRQNANIFTASVKSSDNCPVCGIDGYMGSGDEDIEQVLAELSEFQNSKSFEELHERCIRKEKISWV